MGPADETPKTPEQIINELRFAMTVNISDMEALEKQVQPPVIQEVVLARRHAEDMRMRLGVALARLQGQDPWASKSSNTPDA